MGFVGIFLLFSGTWIIQETGVRTISEISGRFNFVKERSTLFVICDTGLATSRHNVLYDS